MILPTIYIKAVRHAHTDMRTGTTQNCARYIQNLTPAARSLINQLSYQNAETNQHVTQLANILRIPRTEARDAEWNLSFVLKETPWK
tara:strand:- start:187 stop:447 length:261 start_codon:yes stop_codon:yes gene_type:complete